MNYQALYEAKCVDFEELSQQCAEFEQQSQLIINDLEEELKELKRKNESLSREISEQKEKNKCFKSSVEREIELAQRQRNEFKKKFMEFEKKVIELEIMNESLESQLRATKSLLSQYEARTEKTMEELTVVQLELEETNSNNQQIVARLKGQLKETEQELFALHQTKQRLEQGRSNHEPASEKQSQIGISEITATNTNVFKETLKGIRQYLGTLDNRKLEIRRALLKSSV